MLRAKIMNKARVNEQLQRKQVRWKKWYQRFKSASWDVLHFYWTAFNRFTSDTTKPNPASGHWTPWEVPDRRCPDQHQGNPKSRQLREFRMRTPGAGRVVLMRNILKAISHQAFQYIQKHSTEFTDFYNNTIFILTIAISLTTTNSICTNHSFYEQWHWDKQWYPTFSTKWMSEQKWTRAVELWRWRLRALRFTSSTTLQHRRKLRGKWGCHPSVHSS